MAKFLSGLIAAALVCAPAFAAPAGHRFDLAPDAATRWVADRPTGDDFLPPPGGPGPVMSDKDHPYIPNGVGLQPTYRVADLSNPILMPWAREQMKKANEDVLAGKTPFIARERCWPSGMPGFLVDTRIVPVYFLQTPEKIVMIIQNDAKTRHIYMNVPHSPNVKPSWHGESVAHYEGDTLVVDTVGLNDRTFVDNYRTPHTTQLHVVERYSLLDGGDTLQILVTVEDPGAFTMPWSALQRYKRVKQAPPFAEDRCAENVNNFLNETVRPIPRDDTPDF